MATGLLARFSLNQITIDNLSLGQVVDACARRGIQHIGVWRHKLAETGLRASVRQIQDAGLSVSSLCRGGWFDAASARERRTRLDDNFRALDEAAEIGTRTLVIVAGPAAGRDLPLARERTVEALGTLIPYARERGITIGLEPLHPMFAADRCVVNTLAQANDICARLGDQIGVIVDVYHVWWDPAVEEEIARAAHRIAGFHVSDWIVPPPDFLFGRGVMGDGVIEIRRLRRLVDGAGYDGPIEVEILNHSLGSLAADELLDLLETRFRRHV